MEEFAIPSDYLYFTTNALHGLLAQLALRGEEVADDKLGRHFVDYKAARSLAYGGSHQAALSDSQAAHAQTQSSPSAT